MRGGGGELSRGPGVNVLLKITNVKKMIYDKLCNPLNLSTPNSD